MKTENIKAWQELIGTDRNIRGHIKNSKIASKFTCYKILQMKSERTFLTFEDCSVLAHLLTWLSLGWGWIVNKTVWMVLNVEDA